MRLRTESAAGRQDDRDPGAQHNARGVGLRKEGQIFGQHVAGLQVGNDENLSAPCDWRFDALDFRGFRIDGIVEGERAVEHAAGYLAAIRHLAQSGRFDRRRNFRRHSFDRGQDSNARCAETDVDEEVDCVLDDVAFHLEIRENVDGRIGDKQRLRVSRHVHDKDMADTARRPQSVTGRRHRPHELVSMQAPLHQELAFGFANEFHCFGRSRFAMRCIDDVATFDIDAVLAGDGLDLCGRPDQNRLNNAELSGLDRATQG